MPVFFTSLKQLEAPFSDRFPPLKSWLHNTGFSQDF